MLPRLSLDRFFVDTNSPCCCTFEQLLRHHQVRLGPQVLPCVQIGLCRFDLASLRYLLEIQEFPSRLPEDSHLLLLDSLFQK